jgi:hypothetical protein
MGHLTSAKRGQFSSAFTFACFVPPTDPGSSVTGKLEQKLSAVAALGDVPYVTGQTVTIATRHGPASACRPHLAAEMVRPRCHKSLFKATGQTFFNAYAGQTCPTAVAGSDRIPGSSRIVAGSMVRCAPVCPSTRSTPGARLCEQIESSPAGKPMNLENEHFPKKRSPATFGTQPTSS